MTPQARIKARFSEDAANAGVELSITARKSMATEYTAHLFEGRIFYMNIKGEYDESQKFIRASRLTLGMTSGGAFDVTYNMEPRDVKRVLAETEVDPAWLRWNGSTPLRIASEIRDKKAFAQLPILADALEEAGCDNAHLLRHCRAEESQGECCWVIEILVAMGREARKAGPKTGA